MGQTIYSSVVVFFLLLGAAEEAHPDIITIRLLKSLKRPADTSQ